jgi:hypothetical protein
MRHRLAEAELAMAEIHEAAGRPDQARAMWQARLDSTAAFYGAEHEYTRKARARLAAASDPRGGGRSGDGSSVALE